MLESQAYKARIDNMANLFGQLDSIILPMISEERKRQALLYEKLAEEAYYKSIFDIQQYTGYGFNFKALDKKNIEKVLNTNWSGKNFSQRIWDNTNDLAKAVKEEILLNLLTGRPLKKAQDSINNRFQTGASNARRLVRTESCYVCNQLHLKGYEACGVEKYIYLAILDLKTSQVCRSLDKKRFPVSEAQAGKNFPPMHPYCRSTTIADIPDELLKKLKQSAVDPATGERITVPGDMTYKEWYEKYVDKSGAKTGKSVENTDDSGIINEARGSGNFQSMNAHTLSSKTDISVEEIQEELLTSSVGKETLERIKNSDVSIQLLQGVKSPSGERGSQKGSTIKIYLDFTANKRIAAQTVIHEMTHYHYGIGQCQWAEAVCFAKEKMHIEGRNHLTFAEKRYVVGLARDAYPEFNWKKGGLKNGRTL